jgi:hypothetical protein
MDARTGGNSGEIMAKAGIGWRVDNAHGCGIPRVLPWRSVRFPSNQGKPGRPGKQKKFRNQDPDPHKALADPSIFAT